VLGLSYKPGTHIVEESQSVMLARLLIDNGYKVAVHDPAAIDTVKNILGNMVNYFRDVKSACADCSSIVLMTRWPEYENLATSKWLKPGTVIIDSWRILTGKEMPGITCTGLGTGPRPD
jgi:UDPglucose 6-dehydrogenase